MAARLLIASAQYDGAEDFTRSLRRSLEGLKGCAPDEANLEAWLRFSILFSFQRRGREEWDTMTEVARDVVGERGQDMGETIAEYLRKQGREEGLMKGREEGREQGRLEGSRALLAELLTARFPERSAEEIRQKLAGLAEPSLLEALGRRLVAEEPTWEKLWG